MLQVIINSFLNSFEQQKLPMVFPSGAFAFSESEWNVFRDTNECEDLVTIVNQLCYKRKDASYSQEIILQFTK